METYNSFRPSRRSAPTSMFVQAAILVVITAAALVAVFFVAQFVHTL